MEKEQETMSHHPDDLADNQQDHQPNQEVAKQTGVQPPWETTEVVVEETPIRVIPEPTTRQVTEPSTQKNKKQGFWQHYKGTIAVALIASLCGGLVGGTLVSATQGSTPLQIPNSQAPIQVTGGEISPVVAIAEAVGPAVVGISNKGTVQDFFGRQYAAEQGSGSGVIFRADGYIITNNHVIEGATSLMVSLADGREVEATVIGADQATDLAVIKIEADNLAVATLGDSDAVQIGELVVAIGNPLGADFARTVTDGIISGKDRQLKIGDQIYDLLQTNAAINAGNSGGALVNSQGEVIGINSVKVEQAGVEGLGFAIPINEAKPIIEELMNNGYVSRPYMGISGGSIDEQVAKRYQLPITHGVLVVEVVGGSPAHKAGVLPGDIIYKIDNEILKTRDQLTETLKQHKVGDQINLLIDRNGESKEITLTLGDQRDQQSVKQTQNQQFTLPFGY